RCTGAAKHLLAHQLLVLHPSRRRVPQQPQCIVGCLCDVTQRLLDQHPAYRGGTTRTDFYRKTGHRVRSPASEREAHTNPLARAGLLWGCELLSIELCLTTAGLRAVHSLTWPSGRALRMRMRLWEWHGVLGADYSSFSVASEADKFRLNVSGFHGSHPSLRDCMAFVQRIRFRQRP
uniref:Fibrinogen C-terminal domain-containing protein n=1 Tax=Macrostomum lignano TaxID=282301 RepID=A0A1I8FAA4_9PLAT